MTFKRVASTSLLLIGALASACALAQQRIATLTGVHGTVLVSKGEGMAAAVNGQPLASGAKVIATAKSQASIRYDSGCEISMGENSRAIVRDNASCARLQSDVMVLAQAPGAIGGSAGVRAGAPAPSSLAIGGSAALAGGLGYGAYQTFKSEQKATTVSPH